MDYKENKNQQLKDKPKVLAPVQQIDTSKPVSMVVGEPRSVPELLSTQASGQISIDWKAFEQECKRIVNEVSEKFIDLGLEDHESDYAAGELEAKQERFEREFSRLPFNFEAHSLQLPFGAATAVQSGEEDAVLEAEDADIKRQSDVLGNQLAGLHEILFDSFARSLHIKQELHA